jgi:hypothetical protein
MRKRIWLKSPVRENRTPGSVRGLSGNRRSYRDAFPDEKSNNKTTGMNQWSEFDKNGDLPVGIH